MSRIYAAIPELEKSKKSQQALIQQNSQDDKTKQDSHPDMKDKSDKRVKSNKEDKIKAKLNSRKDKKSTKFAILI